MTYSKMNAVNTRPTSSNSSAGALAVRMDPVMQPPMSAYETGYRAARASVGRVGGR